MRSAPSHGTTPTLVLALMLAPALAPAAGAEVIANLIRIEGRIPISRYATGALVTAWQRGEDVLNGSIFSRDRVETGDDASATMELRDGSRWQVGRNTSFTVGELDASRLPGQATGRKPIERNIDLIAGTIEFQVAANPRVATVVRTPGGYLTPASTRFVVSVDQGSGATDVVVVAGEVDFYHPESGLHIALGTGSAMIFTARPGELAISIPERVDLLLDNSPPPAPIVIELRDCRLTAAAGTTFSLRIESSGELVLSVGGGEVTVTEDGHETVVREADPPLPVGPLLPPPPLPPPPRDEGSRPKPSPVDG